MKVHCPGCGVTFSVPDEKVPEGKGFKILCPRCRAPIELEGGLSPGSDAQKREKPAVPPPIAPEVPQEEVSLLDVVEEGVKTALVCIANSLRLAKIEQILRQLDFYVVASPHPSFVLNKLRLNRYDLIVLEGGSDVAHTAENLVLHHIQLLPMHMRRRFFLCLLSEAMPTLDQMLAFHHGVDMVLNVQDLDKAKIILVRALKDHRAFYKVFSEELGRKG